MDEQQYILRLPPDLAERMRHALASKAKRDAEGPVSDFSVNFIDSRRATFTIDDKEYPATLMDLPCIVESHKFTEKRTFYKSGDVGQVLVVRYPSEPEPTSFILPDGITPAAKGAAKRFQPPKQPPFPAEEVTKVENQIKYVADNKGLQFVRKKSDAEDTTAPAKGATNAKEGASADQDEIEIVIENPENEESAAGGPSGKGGQRPTKPDKSTRSGGKKDAAPIDDKTENGDAAETKPPPQASLPSPAPSPMPSPSPLPSPGPDDVAQPVQSPAPSPAPNAPTPQASPGPDAADDEDHDDDDDDDDEFDNMLAESMLNQTEESTAKTQIARVNLTKKIDEKKAQIVEQAERAEKAPNAILAQRYQRRKAELEKELSSLDEELAKLG